MGVWGVRGFDMETMFLHSRAWIIMYITIVYNVSRCKKVWQIGCGNVWMSGDCISRKSGKIRWTRTIL